MRQVLSGAGVDTTSTVAALLASTGKILKKTLYLIGDQSDPKAIWATDSAKSLTWSLWGTFNSANIVRGDVATQIGLDVQTLDITWTPKRTAFGLTVATANPLQLAQFGFYDNWPFKAWTVYLPLSNDGDANTYGASELFAGILGKTNVNRLSIQWEISNLLKLCDQQVPLNVIETANTQAAFTGAIQPAGETGGVPYFTVFTGSTTNVIYGDVLPPYGTHHIFNTTPPGAFAYGYLVFVDGPGSTLGGFWSPVLTSSEFTDGLSNHHNQFVLYKQMPWAPTPWTGSSGDQFYVSAKPPMTQTDATAFGIPYYGFPYVPDPSQTL